MEMMITGPKYKKRLDHLNGRVKFVYVYPTTHGPMSLNEMSDWTERNLGVRILAQTLRTRIARYPQGDPRVFSTEPLPKATVSAWETTAGRDIRHLCKRNKTLCVSYHDCQSSRLGMVGAAPWVEPENTDACFVPENQAQHIPYNSGLECGAISLNLMG